MVVSFYRLNVWQARNAAQHAANKTYCDAIMVVRYRGAICQIIIKLQQYDRYVTRYIALQQYVLWRIATLTFAEGPNPAGSLAGVAMVSPAIITG
jgi:hypothetical protein